MWDQIYVIGFTSIVLITAIGNCVPLRMKLRVRAGRRR
jgi:hypothetical protein